MPFSSLRFGYFCNFRPKVCFPYLGPISKRFKILPFSSDLLLHPFFKVKSRKFSSFYLFGWIFISYSVFCFDKNV
ncbi:hypothetical protein Hanom_Chr08g00732441 [Helianthus anomalus]